MNTARTTIVEGCDLSIVVPTYGGAASLGELCARIERVAMALARDWEVLVVDDASPDDTPGLMRELQARQKRIRYLRLARNGGQHAATVAGLRLARGATVITMDDDLQQAPESIPLLLGALRPEVQVAIARFPRPAQSAWRRWGSRALNALIRPRGGEAPLAITSFKAFRATAAARLVQAVPATGPFYLGTILQSVIPRAELINVDVPHHPRPHGRSTYGVLSLLRLGLRAVRSRPRA